MNAFDVLKAEFPKEFKIVFKRLSYQMLLDEAEILLNMLKKLKYKKTDYDLKWERNFKQYLKTK